MKVLAFNGSPRKDWNTATLLERALEGAASQGMETELVHLYDLDYKGCRSCYSCKLKGGESFGRCAAKDDLTPFLAKVVEADAIIMGSPIYFGAITGEMKSFLERLGYPFWNPAYNSTLLERRIPTGFIYTMGAPESRMKEMGWDRYFSTIEMFMNLVFGGSESLVVTDTLQYDDYSKYVYGSLVNPETKAERRRTVFPEDCQKAFDMGARLASSASMA